jgi:hypothetical protein
MGRTVVTTVAAMVLAQGLLSGAAGAAAASSTGNPRSSGAAWSVQSSPNPTGATNTVLSGIACPSATDCIGVGDYSTETVAYRTLAERWDGGSWTIEKTPNISSDPHDDSILAAVSCAGARSCMAVGYSVDVKDDNVIVRGLVEQMKGTTWKILATPVPSHTEGISFDGVACTASDSCIAVGGLQKSGVYSQGQPLAEFWNGSTWTIQVTQNPEAENGSELSSISCTAADACTAGGNYAFADVDQAIFALRWNGTTWTEQSQPNPGGQGDNTTNGVSCSGTSACTTAGTWTNGGDQTEPLAEYWSGVKWSRQHTPSPAGADITILYGVSCAGASECTAVGSSAANYNGSPATTLAEAWNGAAWRMQATPNPTGGQMNALYAVTCAASGTCTAVGSSWNGTTTQTLVEVRGA